MVETGVTRLHEQVDCGATQPKGRDEGTSLSCSTRLQKSFSTVMRCIGAQPGRAKRAEEGAQAGAADPLPGAPPGGWDAAATERRPQASPPSTQPSASCQAALGMATAPTATRPGLGRRRTSVCGSVTVASPACLRRRSAFFCARAATLERAIVETSGVESLPHLQCVRVLLGSGVNACMCAAVCIGCTDMNAICFASESIVLFLVWIVCTLWTLASLSRVHNCSSPHSCSLKLLVFPSLVFSGKMAPRKQLAPTALLQLPCDLPVHLVKLSQNNKWDRPPDHPEN